jgi:phosphate-selective porin
MRTRLVLAALAVILAPALAAPAAAEEGGTKEWGYNKGFYFKSDRFDLKISTRSQFRFTQTEFDDASASEDKGEFTIPRARLSFDGHAYYPWLTYKIQYDFVGRNITGTNSPDLRDLYLDLAKNKAAAVRLGQFKAPFGIQELTSSGNQQFVDRSITSVEFAPSRQIGAMLHGATGKSKFGYEVGLFNGNGRNRPSNDNDGYMYAARVHFDPAGEYKLSESAVEHPSKTLWTIGAAFLSNATDAAADETDNTLEGFFALKYKGLSVLANAYRRTEEQAVGPDVDADGALAQVGYFFIPKKLEVAVRWAEFDPDTDVSGDTQTETRVGFGYFWSQHNLKFQADYGRIEDESSGTDEETNFFRAQFQIVF